LEFGRKGYRFALACVEMCQSRIDGLLRAHYFQPWGGCEIRARTIAGVFA
jgi:hypothetical protein